MRGPVGMGVVPMGAGWMRLAGIAEISQSKLVGRIADLFVDPQKAAVRIG